MTDLTSYQKQLIRDSAPTIMAKERELALVRSQREEIQKTLSQLLKWKESPHGFN